MKIKTSDQWPVTSGQWEKSNVACLLLRIFSVVLPLAVYSLPQRVSGAQLPSLFRGVVAADSPLGVRVISVEEDSQAYRGDLRPEDLIVRVNDADVHSVDEFATESLALRGKEVSAKVLVFRNGSPLTLTVHLYSYPILNAWNIAFVPDYDFHFAEPEVGRDYWFRLGRGFEGAGKPQEALSAYLNGLHNLPHDLDLGWRAALLWSRVGQDQLRASRTGEGLGSLRNSLVMMQGLFDYPLNAEQLTAIKGQLQATLQAIREVKNKAIKPKA